VFLESIKTASDCLAACRQAQECSGVDIDATSGDQSAVKCDFHFNVNDFNTVSQSSGVTQIRINRCTEEGIYLCNPSYEQTQTGQFSAGGTGISEVQTLDQCKYACQDAAPSCAGFDFDDNNGCYLHSGDTIGQNLSPRPGTNQYNLINACDTVCNPKWAVYENVRGVGAEPAPVTGIGKNASACLEFCLRSRSCAGVEFTPDDVTPCTWYKSGQEQNMKQYQSKASTTQYQLVDNCFSKCNTVYTVVPGVRYFILYPRSVTASNPKECEKQCSADAMCTAIEYTTSGPFTCTIGWNRIDLSSTPDAGYTSVRFDTADCT